MNTLQKHKSKFSIVPYIMIIPTFILLFVFLLYPLYIAIIKSFYNWSGGFGTGINIFVGLQNYVRIFNDERFWLAWGNVLFFAGMGVVINLIFPPLFAILVSRFSEKTSYVIRVLNIIPIVVPSVVVYLLWKTIYNPEYGLLTQIAQIFNSNKVIDMLGNPDTAKWAFVLMGFPWTGGTVFLIYYAGINNISSEVLEAATLDGASITDLLWFIYYPLLFPQMKLISALQLIGGIQGFINIQTITGGGPGDATYVPGLYIYDMAFGGSNRYGVAAAASVVMAIVICALVVLNNYVFTRKDGDD